MLKVVLDTNVLIDGSTDDFNYGRRIMDEVIAGDIQAYANHATLAENRLLTREKITDEGYLKRLNYFFDKITEVEYAEVEVDLEDREDVKLLQSAVGAAADYLITADNHLLKLEKFHGVKIVRPSEFWHRYQDNSDRGWLGWMKDFIK